MHILQIVFRSDRCLFDVKTVKMFTKNKRKPAPPPVENHEPNNVSRGYHEPNSPVSKPQLVFHCQLAHGSPTGFVSGFSNVKELYQKIADYFEFPFSEVSV